MKKPLLFIFELVAPILQVGGIILLVLGAESKPGDNAEFFHKLAVSGCICVIVGLAMGAYHFFVLKKK